jgi:2-dehydro-3-deoxyphosphogluconate aldolase/(4S)-4-hydroxy-2-oxoglutarate aldolase
MTRHHADGTSPVLDSLRASGVIAILRGTRADRIPAVADVLVTAGISCIEITLNTAGALAALAALAAAPPSGSMLGAGTVLSPDAAARAVDAGARYLVTPNVDPAVIAAGVDRGVAVFPGALTPTEIAAAWTAGAAAVKVFPAGALGADYIRAVRAPLDHIPLVPTGGISIDAADTYLDAGAIGVAIGGPLVGDALEGGDLRTLAERARGLVASLGARAR